MFIEFLLIGILITTGAIVNNTAVTNQTLKKILRELDGDKKE